MSFIENYFNFQHNVSIYAMAYARLAIIFYFLPVFGQQIFSNLIIKNTIISLTIIGLWPYVAPDDSSVSFTINNLLSECLVGFILAIILSLPFWIVSMVGDLIDNQRGATMSSSIDPVSGVNASILSGLLTFSFGAIFFAQNGMILLVKLFIQSYILFPRGSSLDKIHWPAVWDLLSILVRDSIIIAAPIMIVLMISEVLLGVLARYCQQLNPFSLSLTVKSFLAFLIFLFYGYHAISWKLLHLIFNTQLKHFIS